ncbi:hypothetical protein MLD38_035402 [Melastoma candidum]|uniref:Uncharacterized protein n=1 Tax=Melastoma candidum TaxID=119954 RepID=A0ACB9LHQ4_9MYRT|nr:hypothetical protein MLD38_035402 [Melastoma candidum]
MVTGLRLPVTGQAQGSGSGFKSIRPVQLGYFGRAMKFHLCFDPTQDFHHYATLGRPNEITFLVDDIPIRRYPRKSDATFRPGRCGFMVNMGRVRRGQQRMGSTRQTTGTSPSRRGTLTSRRAGARRTWPRTTCRPVSASPYPSGRLTGEQNRAMQWVQSNHLAYDYCKDYKRDHSLSPECYM